MTARWAPITSLFMRLISAPVWVRVKKAIGMRCTWSNSATRRSKIRPSPIRDDHQPLDRWTATASANGDRHHEPGQQRDRAPVLLGDGVVDDLADQQRRDQVDEGGEDDRGQEPGQHRAGRGGRSATPAGPGPSAPGPRRWPAGPTRAPCEVPSACPGGYGRPATPPQARSGPAGRAPPVANRGPLRRSPGRGG